MNVYTVNTIVGNTIIDYIFNVIITLMTQLI